MPRPPIRLQPLPLLTVHSISSGSGLIWTEGISGSASSSFTDCDATSCRSSSPASSSSCSCRGLVASSSSALPSSSGDGDDDGGGGGGCWVRALGLAALLCFFWAPAALFFCLGVDWH